VKRETTNLYDHELASVLTIGSNENTKSFEKRKRELLTSSERMKSNTISLENVDDGTKLLHNFTN